MRIERTNTDILILGSGGAGLFAALHAYAANPDLDITIATKRLLGKCGWTLVSTAVERVRELENEIGCFFDRNPDGTLHGKAFAGQTFDRTVHKGDLTGIEIISRLMEQVWARPIQRLEEHRAVGLVPSRDGAMAGVLMIDI